MSVYGGFCTRKQENDYNFCLQKMMFILAKRCVKAIHNVPVDANRFAAYFGKIFGMMIKLEESKYQPPKLSDALYELADALGIKDIDMQLSDNQSQLMESSSYFNKPGITTQRNNQISQGRRNISADQDKILQQSTSQKSKIGINKSLNIHNATNASNDQPNLIPGTKNYVINYKYYYVCIFFQNQNNQNQQPPIVPPQKKLPTQKLENILHNTNGKVDNLNEYQLVKLGRIIPQTNQNYSALPSNNKVGISNDTSSKFNQSQTSHQNPQSYINNNGLMQNRNNNHQYSNQAQGQNNNISRQNHINNIINNNNNNQNNNNANNDNDNYNYNNINNNNKNNYNNNKNNNNNNYNNYADDNMNNNNNNNNYNHKHNHPSYNNIGYDQDNKIDHGPFRGQSQNNNIFSKKKQNNDTINEIIRQGDQQIYYNQDNRNYIPENNQVVRSNKGQTYNNKRNQNINNINNNNRIYAQGSQLPTDQDFDDKVQTSHLGVNQQINHRFDGISMRDREQEFLKKFDQSGEMNYKHQDTDYEQNQGPPPQQPLAQHNVISEFENPENEIANESFNR